MPDVGELVSFVLKWQRPWPHPGLLLVFVCQWTKSCSTYCSENKSVVTLFPISGTLTRPFCSRVAGIKGVPHNELMENFRLSTLSSCLLKDFLHLHLQVKLTVAY